MYWVTNSRIGPSDSAEVMVEVADTAAQFDMNKSLHGVVSTAPRDPLKILKTASRAAWQQLLPGKGSPKNQSR
jgi:hypothetical protein